MAAGLAAMCGVPAPAAAPPGTGTQPAAQTRPSGTEPQTAPSSRPQPQERPEPVVEAIIDGDPLVRLLPRDAIPPLDAPEMVPAREAESFMDDDEMVLGVVDGGEARAYSTWHLDRHEVVNDRLGETPIAATW